MTRHWAFDKGGDGVVQMPLLFGLQCLMPPSVKSRKIMHVTHDQLLSSLPNQFALLPLVLVANWRGPGYSG